MNEAPLGPLFSGYVELITRERVVGWIWNQLRPNERLTIVIKLGSEVIGETLANTWRPDLEAAGIGDGYHAFELRFAPDLSREQMATLEFYVNGEVCAISIAPSAVQRNTFKGNIDVLTQRCAAGWVWNESIRTERVKLMVHLGDECIAAGIANRWRPDLFAAGIGDGRHSFTLNFNRHLTKKELGIVMFKVADEEYLIPIEKSALGAVAWIWDDMFIPPAAAES